MRRLVPAFFALPLGGCAVISGPLTGQLENGSETFTGAISQKITGQGTLAIKTSTGAACEGTFSQFSGTPDPSAADPSTHVRGIMKCSDGRTGTFHIVAGAFARAVVTGDLGGQRITMTLE